MEGIITKAIGGFFFVADKEQNIHQTKIRGKIKEKVYPGDRVEFSEEGMIEAVYPRESLLFRPMVANLDQVLIMQSLANPPLNRILLDRFLLMAEAAGLKSLIIINKIDLVDDKDYQTRLADYTQAGYPVFFVSIKKKIGLKPLHSYLSRKINVLTGPSGVGKSSLLNVLVSGADLPTGSVSRKLKRGMHTTSYVELLPLDERGWVADTPGFTSLDINHILPEELSFFFPKIRSYATQCKFRGCSHTHEPDCAVKKAVSEGLISSERYKSYILFYEEIIR